MKKLLKKRRKFLGAYCIFITIGLLFVGLWPFDFSPKNKAFWVSNGKGLYFDGKKRNWKLSVGSIAYLSSLSSSWQIPMAGKGSLTIAIHLQPEEDTNGGVPHILSLVEKSGKVVLYLGQWKQSLIVRWFSSKQKSSRDLREISVGKALLKEKSQWLMIVSNQKETTLYVGDEIEERFPGTSLLTEGSSVRDYKVVLGNSPEANSPWTGTILDLALYDRSFDKKKVFELLKGSFLDVNSDLDGLISAFNFEGEEGARNSDISGNGNVIVVPKQIISKGKVLEWPDKIFRTNNSIVIDLVVNVCGFIPFGFLLLLWFKDTKRWNHRYNFLIVILIGGLISLGIEMSQVYIPARDSSLADVLYNTVGTLLGCVGLYLFSIKRIISSN
ncbi:MAG: VanZ family protein [Candidatus Aminicenantes bacterium]|nr:VanZ family protein [Candidatus Aminicenantes bacterium]